LRTPDFLLIPGLFHKAPVAYGGFFWALSREGTLYRLSPRTGAKPRVLGSIPSSTAAFSQFALTTILVADSPATGPVLIAADTASIYAASLLDGRVHTLFTAESSAAIAVNPTVEESPYFRGVCAGNDFYAFVQRSGGDMSLFVRPFAREGATEAPVRFASAPYLGPVTKGSGIGLCSSSDLWIYDTGANTTLTFALPGSFQPYVQRPLAVHVPLGHVPFVIDSAKGWRAWIGGEMNGQPGVLEVQMDRNHYKFTAAERDATICQVSSGGLCLNTGGALTMFGAAQPPWRITSVEAGMPVGASGSWLAHFQRRDGSMQTVNVFGDGIEPFSASFEDASCDEDSCCGLFLVDGRHLLVSYPSVPRDPNQPIGLKFAHWNLQ
jgi:hypothetical protein